MLKPFEEMRKINVDEWAKDRDGFKYLPWARAIDLLYKNGASKVCYEVVKDANGSSLHHSDLIFVDKNSKSNMCYEVVVRLTVDDETYEETYPVMNGVSPIKDDLMSQQRVRTSVARALVKCIATNTGLGFDLWLDGEECENETTDDLSKHSLKAIKERMEQEVTALMKKGVTFPEIAKSLGFEEDVFRSKFSYFSELYNIEKRLIELLNGGELNGKN